MIIVHPEAPHFFGIQATLSPTPKMGIPGFRMVLSAFSQVFVFNAFL
jgi:uncharacterized protein YyaL (SSP411 family)